MMMNGKSNIKSDYYNCMCVCVLVRGLFSPSVPTYAFRTIEMFPDQTAAAEQ